MPGLLPAAACVPFNPVEHSLHKLLNPSGREIYTTGRERSAHERNQDRDSGEIVVIEFISEHGRVRWDFRIDTAV